MTKQGGMTRVQHLLAKFAEECNEVAQRALKAQQFGIGEVQEGQPLNNAERVIQEFGDLLGVYTMLEDEEILPTVSFGDAIAAKRKKVEKYLRYAEKQGMVITA